MDGKDSKGSTKYLETCSLGMSGKKILTGFTTSRARAHDFHIVDFWQPEFFLLYTGEVLKTDFEHTHMN